VKGAVRGRRAVVGEEKGYSPYGSYPSYAIRNTHSVRLKTWFIFYVRLRTKMLLRKLNCNSTKALSYVGARRAS